MITSGRVDCEAVLRIAVLLLLSLAACAPASRQREPTTPAQPRPPSEPIHDAYGAEELYKSERFAEAAWVFEQLLTRPPDPNGSHDRTQFWLAKSFYQLGDYPRALELFRDIARNPEHEYYVLTLPWLASLSTYLHDEAVEPMSWYPVEGIDNEAFDEIRDELQFLFGRWYATHGQRELGERLLREVPLDSDYYANACVELAESMWRAGNERDALPLYRAGLERWNTERSAMKPRQRKQQPVPEYIELAIERLRSRGVPVGPRGELD